MLIHPTWEILIMGIQAPMHGLMSMIPMWENNPCEDHNTYHPENTQTYHWAFSHCLFGFV